MPHLPSARAMRMFGVCWIAAIFFIGMPALADPQPAPIPAEAAVPKEKVHGLRVAYHDFGRRRPPGVPGIDSMEIAQSFVNQTPADVTLDLKTRYVDFPAGEAGTIPAAGKTLREFLLPAGAEGGGPEFDTKMSSRNIFVFDGFVEVKRPGVYDIRGRCDDAVEITIGGVVVLSAESGGMYGPFHKPYHARVEFAEPGFYPVQVLFWDKQGDAGVEIYSTLDESGEAREFGPGQDLHLLPLVVADQ
jgi:hypothetical protein